MTGPSDHLPDNLSHAFAEAVILFIKWKGGKAEPVVSLEGKPIPIGLVFDLVAGRGFVDKLPGSVLDLLLAYASTDPRHQPQLSQLTLDPTYKYAARCLRKWLNEKSQAS
jgi:hypothetical protein